MRDRVRQSAPAPPAADDRVRELIDAIDEQRGKREPGVVVALRERVADQVELNMLMNQMKEVEEPVLKRRIGEQIREKQRQFHASNGGGHSTPAWIIPTMDACVAITLGDAHAALNRDRAALAQARNNWQRAISLANISDSLREMGRYAEAVRPALQAIAADPLYLSGWCYLTMALWKSGRGEAAAEILRTVPAMDDVNKPSSVWRSYLTSYNEFGEMRHALPEAQHLFSIVGAA